MPVASQWGVPLNNGGYRNGYRIDKQKEAGVERLKLPASQVQGLGDLVGAAGGGGDSGGASTSARGSGDGGRRTGGVVGVYAAADICMSNDAPPLADSLAALGLGGSCSSAPSAGAAGATAGAEGGAVEVAGKDKGWDELDVDERKAAAFLGYSQERWECGEVARRWAAMSKGERAAAELLGYVAEEWDEEYAAQKEQQAENERAERRQKEEEQEEARRREQQQQQRRQRQQPSS